MKKVIGYLKRDMDFPIYISDGWQDNELMYPLDLMHMFENYPFNHISFDKDGILQFDYSLVPAPNNLLGKQHNITYISKWALCSLQKYLKTNAVSFKDEFLKCARWLFSKGLTRGNCVVWEAGFDWDSYGVRLERSRVSSMDQGLAISVILRAYRLTGDHAYYDMARRGAEFYKVDLKDGGFRCEFSPGYIFYEAFPVQPVSRTLDCFLFSLYGLYDLFRLKGDRQVKALFDEGARTLLDNLSYWDYKGCWSRFNRHYLSPPWYHKMNCCWMGVYYEITKDKGLKERSEGWDPMLLSPYQKAQIRLFSFLLSRRYRACMMLKQIYGKSVIFLEILSARLQRIPFFFFTKSRLILFRKEADISGSDKPRDNGLAVRRINYANVKDAGSMDSRLQVREFEGMLDDKEEGFFIYSDGQVIHRSWAIVGPGKAPLFYDYIHIDLKPDEALIHYCSTKEGYRNKGVFKGALRYISGELSGASGVRKIYIAVEEKNAASLKAVKDSGFTEYGRFGFIRFLGIKRVKQIKAVA